MRLSRTILAIFVFILPFVYFPNIFNPYEFPKFLFFVIGVQLLTIYFIFRFLFASEESRLRKLSLPPSEVLLWIFISGFVIINLVSDLFGLDPKTSLLGSGIRHQGFITLISSVLLFFLVRDPSGFALRMTEKGRLPINKMVLICAFLISLVAIFQAIQLNIFHSSIWTYNGRIVGTFGNPNFLAGYLVMLLPLVLFPTIQFSPPRCAAGKTSNVPAAFDCGATPPRRWDRFVKIIVVLLMLISIFFTNSTSAFLAVVLLFFLILIHFLKPFYLKAILVLILVSFIAGFITLTFAKTGSRGMTITERGCSENWPSYLSEVSKIYNNNRGFFKRSSPCDNRFLIWSLAVEKVIQRPILGFGAENFDLLIPNKRMFKADNAHNIFLETVVSSGIIGLILFTVIIFYCLKKADFSIRLSLIAFLITAQFNPLSISQIALFWFLLGASGSISIGNHGDISG